jgi:hypothetical protein
MSVKKDKLKSTYFSVKISKNYNQSILDRIYRDFPDTFVKMYEAPSKFLYKNTKHVYPYEVYKDYPTSMYLDGNNYPWTVWGIKKLPDNCMHFLPRSKNYNIFWDKNKNSLVKFFGWWSIYVDGLLEDPPMFYVNVLEDCEISAFLAYTRLFLWSSLHDKLKIKSIDGYEGVVYNTSGISSEYIKDFFGKNAVQLDPKKYVKNMTIRHLDNNFFEFGPNKRDMEFSKRWDARWGKFVEQIKGHDYEINIYCHNELVMKIPTGKKPLRVNIDYDDSRSALGLCQFTLWFFFGITEWQDNKQYFTIGD